METPRQTRHFQKIPYPGTALSTPSTPPPARTSIWVFLRPYTRPFRGLIFLALFLSAFHGLAITFQNLVPKYLIDNVLLAPGLSGPQRYHRVLLLILFYLATAIVFRMLVWHLGYRVFTYVREKVLFALRADFFRHVNHLCLRFHLKHHSGELFSYLFGSPLAQLQNYFQQFTFTYPGAVCQVLTTLVWLGVWDPLLTGILLILVLISALLLVSARRRIEKLQQEFQTTESSVSGYVADLLRGRRDVKLYVMENQVVADFQDRVWQIGVKAYTRDVKSHVEFMKQETASYLCFALLCVACTWRYLHDQSLPGGPGVHRISIGEIQGYLISFISLQGPISQIFTISTLQGTAQAGTDRIASVLATDSTTPEPIGTPVILPPRGAIDFQNVTFSYDGSGGQPVLHNLTLHIPYGQKVALVGPSGAGKSTFAQLLLRLYDPDSGTVRVGGIDLRHCAAKDLRRNFAVVPQDPFIFRTTVRLNLTVARADATDDQLRRACEQANAWEFIQRLPGGLGLDTPIGEGGSTLSGGQRQRLAIARALLTEQEFFIFDEATSALDTVSERLIQDAIATAVRHCTGLIIAHRLATVQSCDRILVMENGAVVQDGTYNELIERPGLFRNLVQSQTLRG